MDALKIKRLGVRPPGPDGEAEGEVPSAEPGLA